MTENTTEIITRAVLVSADTGEFDAERSLDELEELSATAGVEVVGRVIQKRPACDSATVIGSGRLEQLVEEAEALQTNLIIFDCELTANQTRNIERILDIRVIDRTTLILDIFAQRALTKEGRLQVELAQQKYRLPRLAGKGIELSRLGGGIGTRGPGESKLETDKRHIRRRIESLEAELKELERRRELHRARRKKDNVLSAAIVGYTNVGKSTLLNALTDAGILAEDKLFATLDPTTRKYELPCGESVLLTDTVGFINKLPHHLVSAFHSTLEEACMADVLLIIIDASDPRFSEQLEVTENLLVELGAVGKPTLYVFNKCDRGFAELREIGRSSDADNIAYISALTGQGMDTLISKLEAIVIEGKRRVTYFIPNSDGGALNTLYRVATVEDVEYGADGMTVVALADAKARGMMKKYALDDAPEPKEDWEE